MDAIISKIVTKKQPCIFISPHLDDAMLSAGGLIQYLSNKTQVMVVNVFTESSDEKQTLSAWKFIKDMGYSKPSILFHERQLEDIKAYEGMGIVPINLEFHDALWRKKTGILADTFGQIIPEFKHVYPTYRFHMTQGKIAKADEHTMELVGKKLNDIVKSVENPLIFVPLGVGSHVDHCLVRDVCKKLFAHNLVYWSDFPYNFRENNEGTPPAGYQKHEFKVNQTAKEDLIKAYNTQVLGLFQNGIIPIHREIFFTKHA